MSDIEISEREQTLVWRGLGRKSARQMAEELGVTPERVMQIKRSLIESVDILTIQEKRTKLLVDLQEIARKTQDDYDKASDERNKAGLMNSSIAAMKLVLSELNRAEKSDTTKVTALNQLRVRELVTLIQESVDTSIVELAETLGVDEGQLFEVFNRNLSAAAQRREIV